MPIPDLQMAKRSLVYIVGRAQGIAAMAYVYPQLLCLQLNREQLGGLLPLNF